MVRRYPEPGAVSTQVDEEPDFFEGVSEKRFHESFLGYRAESCGGKESDFIVLVDCDPIPLGAQELMVEYE